MATQLSSTADILSTTGSILPKQYVEKECLAHVYSNMILPKPCNHITMEDAFLVNPTPISTLHKERPCLCLVSPHFRPSPVRFPPFSPVFPHFLPFPPVSPPFSPVFCRLKGPFVTSLPQSSKIDSVGLFTVSSPHFPQKPKEMSTRQCLAEPWVRHPPPPNAAPCVCHPNLAVHSLPAERYAHNHLTATIEDSSSQGRAMAGSRATPLHCRCTHLQR